MQLAGWILAASSLKVTQGLIGAVRGSNTPKAERLLPFDIEKILCHTCNQEEPDTILNWCNKQEDYS